MKLLGSEMKSAWDDKIWEDKFIVVLFSSWMTILLCILLCSMAHAQAPRPPQRNETDLHFMQMQFLELQHRDTPAEIEARKKNERHASFVDMFNARVAAIKAMIAMYDAELSDQNMVNEKLLKTESKALNEYLSARRQYLGMKTK